MVGVAMIGRLTMEWETDHGWSSDEWQIDNGYVMSWGSDNCHIITLGE